ncbi:hypothetical protein AYR62_05715 [Secundilactobacillus paracollinoides]|uniref:DUF5626 domain-containing protein n=2 Tax=Secundilactobacillus paracollinoides TaxID=240427 RepID=A0A1B2J0N1_9LACO|nr:hypothetical protein [Secundilactobacillus paracollinoides]ANZ61950.1 hypothetical protein AYR61_11725 [Secundilactobacillus paracollinoides]ANZ63637.1 hypothetical protein AYR62_05715 [Secundilactobacillus paracollinoides]ANZ67896.1 hypothetical protein AYR63_12620 [Secundilactobacillus paracollinoides]KRL79315.1 hypothetical protein FC17_GL000581 [Secundilactobacillus paracollinoides DSM 15502 = JCM 11969]
MIKEIGLGVAFAATVTICGLATAPTANAKTTYLPTSIRNHVWYQITSGTEGGFHDKTTFKGNAMTVNIAGTNYKWHFTGLKKSSKTVYYGRLHYAGGKSDLVKIKIKSSKKFDIIPKHFMNLKGNYTGNESYGAMIYTR